MCLLFDPPASYLQWRPYFGPPPAWPELDLGPAEQNHHAPSLRRSGCSLDCTPPGVELEVRYEYFSCTLATREGRLAARIDQVLCTLHGRGAFVMWIVRLLTRSQ